MVSTAKSPQTVADLYRLPSDDNHHELTRGLLVSEPPQGGRHGRIAANVVYALSAYAQRTGNGVVYTCDTGFILARNPDTVRAPDVSYLSRERYLELADDTRLIPGPPTLAVEVLSPGNRRAQVEAKVADYLEFGTPLVWVCDPREQTLQAFTAGEDFTYDINTVVSAGELLPDFEMPLCGIFRSAL